ncbi:Transaldolase [Ananas comosus]|uniref:Transaldolase n=1 Tax=Ananas comosus TaxID=4615 RepID=A0A199V2G0_ANACO|nr:Transaldolase [Ananas comosus]
MPLSLSSPSPSSSLLSSSSSSSPSPQAIPWRSSSTAPAKLLFRLRRSFPAARVAGGGNAASSSLDAELSTELDAVASFSEIVPDTVVFDDFERFPPTAATVSSSLLLDKSSSRMTCFLNKALVNVGADLAKLVPGRVSTEVDARLAYDTQGIIHRVHDLLKLYNEVEVSSQRLLFKIPSTWQGIEASRLLESEGIQTHLTFVYSFAQAAAAAQAGASVIQIFVGRIRDWARNHSGDPEIEAALKNGEDPGLALVKKTYNYIHKYGHKSKLMAAAVRNKQDVFSLLGIDYIIAPLKVLQSLKESITSPDEKYSFLVKWDQLSFAAALGPAAEELLATGLEGYVNQTARVEELFGKIWPPPNV